MVRYEDDSILKSIAARHDGRIKVPAPNRNDSLFIKAPWRDHREFP